MNRWREDAPYRFQPPRYSRFWAPAIYRLSDDSGPDRIAGTILKLEEDLFGESIIRGRRRADVTFCTPLDAHEFLDRYDQDPKATTHQVTTLLQDAIQQALAAQLSDGNRSRQGLLSALTR